LNRNLFHLAYKDIDFSEPIPSMIDRLIREHRELTPKLGEIENVSKKSPSEAAALLLVLRTTILRHAVQEEARIMRVVLKDAKSESADSVRIMQEHRWVSEFLERRLNDLPQVSSKEAGSEIEKFIVDLRHHFDEEEQIVFPLALKALASENSV